MDLFIFRDPRDEKHVSEDTDNLIQKALALYMAQASIPSADTLAILRTGDGKPYFRDSDIFFSVSHTGPYFGCLIGKHQAGLDIQIERDVKMGTSAIAERYFTDSECDYIDDHGDDGFFDIWVRKEAYIKFLGITLGDSLSNIETVENGKLKDVMEGGGAPAFMYALDLGKGIKCACALAEKDRIWIKKTA